LRAPEKIASASSEVPRSKMVLCTMGRWNGAFAPPGPRPLAPPWAHRVARERGFVLTATTPNKVPYRSRSPQQAMIEQTHEQSPMGRVSCFSSYDTLASEARAHSARDLGSKQVICGVYAVEQSSYCNSQYGTTRPR
jgi:hypothetical protein